MSTALRRIHCVGVLLACSAPVHSALSQTLPQSLPQSLPQTLPRRESAADSIARVALAASDRVRAAELRVAAAQQRTHSATRLPEPMLMAGVQNMPSTGGFGEEMTMKMIGVTQTLPAPGRRRAAERVATFELEAARAEADAARIAVQHDARVAYYDIAYLDRALDLALETRDQLVDLERVASAQYASGGGGQSDVLRVRLELTQLADAASGLREERATALAQLNALLKRRSDAPLPRAEIPDVIATLARPLSSETTRYASAALGARVLDARLPSLDSLQALALTRNAMLLAHAARMDAQEARVDLARREQRPDVDIALQYGQRAGRPDMLSAIVSVPLRRPRAVQSIAAAELSEEAAQGYEHEAEATMIRADVARMASMLERSRTQLTLVAQHVTPQARAVRASALATYRAGGGSLASVLEAQTALFSAEATYARALSDFAKALAELEQTIGTEISR